MIDGLPWYPRYVGDYARKTKHLTMLEHGAYTLLLDHYYATGKPLFFSNANGNAELMPDHSRLYRLCSAITKPEQDAVDSVLRMFFEMTPDGYINKKAAETIEKQQVAHARRSNAGKKGGKQKASNARSNANSNAKAKPKQPEPEPEPYISISKDIESSGHTPDSLLMSDGRFLSPDKYCQELWEIYPSVGRGKGHKGKFFDYIKKALKKGIDHEEIRNGVTRYAEYCTTTGELNKDAFRWARDAEWQNDYQISAAAHRPQQGPKRGEAPSSLTKVIDAAEKAKETIRRQDGEG